MGSTKQKLSRREISAAIKKAVRKDAKTRAHNVALQVAEDLKFAREKGDMLCSMDRVTFCKQATCNHRKGGMIITRPTLFGEDATTVIAESVTFPTQGTDFQYAVVKHVMMNQDIWVFCIRCGKKWKPPIRADYKTETQFVLACVEYQKAVEFPTNNKMSGSVLVAFKKANGSEQFRKLLRNT